MNHRIGMRMVVRCVLLILAASAIAGCISVREGKLDEALFPRSRASAGSGLSAPIAVVADSALMQFKFESSRRLSNSLSYKLVIPIGHIVEAAAVAALTDEFGDSVAVYPSSEAASDATRSVAPLTLVAPRPAQFELHNESLPLPMPFVVIPIPTRQDVRLIVDWSVLDTDGRLLWTKRYDSGDIKLPFEQHDERDFYRENQWVRLAHPVAYRLMREAAHDLKVWFESERLRERAL